MKIRDAIRGRPYIYELDYSQLEIYVLAAVSKCPQLIQDCIDDVDTHAATAAESLGVEIQEVTKDQRQAAKPINFKLTYGGQAPSIAAATGRPVQECQDQIDGFYRRYPGVGTWHKWLTDTADDEARHRGAKVGSEPVKEWEYDLGYGKRYMFRQEVNKWGPSFSPPKLKNWPVQGTASDVIRIAKAKLARMRRELFFSGLRPAAQVHDSIVLTGDRFCRSGVLPRLVRIKRVMELYPVLRLRELGFDWPDGLPLRVDAEYGQTWSEMEKLPLGVDTHIYS